MTDKPQIDHNGQPIKYWGGLEDSKKEIEVKLDTYKVLSEIVEAGVEIGFTKANSVTINPNEQTMKEYIVSNVMIKLEQYLKF